MTKKKYISLLRKEKNFEFNCKGYIKRYVNEDLEAFKLYKATEDDIILYIKYQVKFGWNAFSVFIETEKYKENNPDYKEEFDFIRNYRYNNKLEELLNEPAKTIKK